MAVKYSRFGGLEFRFGAQAWAAAITTAAQIIDITWRPKQLLHHLLPIIVGNLVHQRVHIIFWSQRIGCKRYVETLKILASAAPKRQKHLGDHVGIYNLTGKENDNWDESMGHKGLLESAVRGNTKSSSASLLVIAAAVASL